MGVSLFKIHPLNPLNPLYNPLPNFLLSIIYHSSEIAKLAQTWNHPKRRGDFS